MRRYYIDKNKLEAFIEYATEVMRKNNIFWNIEVKEYKGKKYDRDSTVVVLIG